MNLVATKVEKWKQKLLDLGKRNRLLNYKETKRSNLSIVRPGVDELFDLIVNQNQTLEFALMDSGINIFNYDMIEETSKKVDIKDIPLDKRQVLSNKSDSEMLKTLAQIRARAKTALEEQGVNILYLAFGFLEWKEIDFSNTPLKSPMVLVPVKLSLESMFDPYKLSMSDDDIVVNPTLLFKLERDFNIVFPEINEHEDISIYEYLDNVEKIISTHGWSISKEAHLSLLSFLKLNMYEDLDKHSDKAAGHPIVMALAGDKSGVLPIPEELLGDYDHDSKSRPIDTFQVVDADSSQQDAVIATKKGVSFVLQGPPGTGKSQTITNIIAECLAEGKKVLFVSEKMAALEVVYKRLKETGLTDFSLQLHSHKANKKDVLNELGRTLNMSKSHTREDAIAELDQLLEDRNRLNEYVKVLHEPCDPLGKSIYEIHGRVLRFEDAPDIAFNFDNVEKTTQGDINKYRRLLEQFSRTVDKLGADYKSNPWLGCKVKAFTLELQHDIMTHFKNLNQMLKGLDEVCRQVTSELFLSKYDTVGLVVRLKEILDVAANSTKPPVSWIVTQEIEPLIEKAKAFSALSDEYKTIKDELLTRYCNNVLTINAKELYRQLNDNIDIIQNGLNQACIGDREVILAKREWLNEFVPTAIALFKGLDIYGEQLAEAMGIQKAATISELKSKVSIASNLLHNPKPALAWFDSRQFSIVKMLYSEAKSNYGRIAENERKLFEVFDKEILKIDYNAILARYKTDYNSVFKYVKPGYYRDIKAISVLKKDPSKKLRDSEIVLYLQLLKERDEAIAWVGEHTTQLNENLGTWFNEGYTDWEALSLALSTFEAILASFTFEEIPEKIKKMLLNSGDSIHEIRTIFDKVNPLLDQEGIIDIAQTLFKFNAEICNVSFEELHKVKDIILPLEIVFICYDKVIACLNEKTLSPFSTVLTDLEKVSKLHESENMISEQSKDIEQLYGYYFQGIDTDWQNVLNSLAWSSDFRRNVQTFELTDKFIEIVCTENKAISIARKAAENIGDYLSNIKPEFDYLKNLFENVCYDYENMDLIALSKWLETCTGNFGALEEWLDFVRSREQCEEAGLGDFINAVIERKLPNQSIVTSFFKRFYRLWLDSMYLRYPALNEFRRRNHESIINNFKEMDKMQLIIARARIREVLSAKLPMVGAISSGKGEIDILRRELSKRRRIMPLRKLFKSIPNLLLALKPCLMMSPLSVSLFIDPESYKFDVVIFDEASQICTEDAIGAVFRAEQVIIAGDSEQLPPTNFFNASTGESDFDEDDESDVESFESVLDEARSVLPEKSLRWHYRSKHEHLISFSNVKIYSKKFNSLITFPSCIDRMDDHGVEYIHVPNGVYDRSGSRTNKFEAHKVAELVFDHFMKFPNRSLGVVTFSQSQQNEVESAIRYMRGKNTRFEQFFDESKEEPFFIKNLENVQGDERDTIIFSIGYAKDQNGVMYMNFGPLSKNGGYRRLNVAITRAKYNVKLVGSIRSTDIDLERTSSDGVKMLRSYIEFAQIGPDALLNEIIEPEYAYTDSPFEDEVYNILISQGYKVKTQVGCSGYRIDMAIKHPTISGRYVIGIECDGATYHSARTARERDRLREDVLRMRGWKLYRIWSTDWIKDPRAESQRLIAAIEEALNSDCEDEIAEQLKPTVPLTSDNDLLDEICEDVQEAEVNNHGFNGYDFFEYKFADIYNIERLPRESDSDYLSRIIKLLVEVEGPIHFELVCKKLACFFGREKATSPIRNTIDRVLKTKLYDVIVKKDDFCWLKGVEGVEVRTSVPDIRKIEYICKEELAEAMYAIVQYRFGITYDDLIVETARIFGFNRTGGKIREAMLAAMVYLVEQERVIEQEGKIAVKN